MHKALAIILAGLGTVTLAGAAAAASRDTHTLNVPLPDGSSVRVDYVGDVAPKVSVTPAPISAPWGPLGIFAPGALDMQRRIDAMMREMDAVAKQSVTRAPGLNVAAYGDAPAGTSSVTVVTTSAGGKTCTRTTEVTSQGSGKAPKVVSNISGDCAGASAAPTANGT